MPIADIHAALCMHCMKGKVIGGRCTNCGRAPETAQDRCPAALPLNTRLHGRYYLGDVLGQGGFGITYIAWDTKANRRVAIKELYPTNDVYRENHRTVAVRPGQETYFAHVFQCFANEAKVLMELQHEGVVRVYHLFEENNTVYYVMEYLEGSDLSAKLGKEGTQTWPEMEQIVRDILSALESLHRRGLIHRDISPDNIFLTTQGRAMLIDFGSVRNYQGKHSFTVFLKHNFAPWEQYQSHGNQGPWTDIYALCATLYYCLSGKLPPKAPDRAKGAEVVPLLQYCPDTPAYVAAAIEKGMALKYADRFRSVAELKHAFFPKLTERVLYCAAGYWQGHSWKLQPGTVLLAGRDGSRAQLKYPVKYAGVSHLQCTIRMDESGRVIARDEGSSFGTFCAGARLEPRIWYLVEPGYCLSFGNERFLLK